MISVIAFSSVEEAINIANDTNFGLVSSLHTKDLNTALKVAKALRADTVSVNLYSEGGCTSHL